MCKGKNEPGGPYRCSGHARAARDAARAKLDDAVDDWEHAETAANAANADYQAALTEAGVTSPFAALFGDYDGAELDAEQRSRLDALAAKHEDASARFVTAEKARAAAQEVLEQREDEYRATPDGAAEAARDLERAIAVNGTPLVQDTAKRRMYVHQEMRKLQAAEQQMVNDAAERAARWNNGNTKPPMRAAFPGGQYVVKRTEPISHTGLLVAESHMHGSYTNTFDYDPDSQETAGSSGDPDRMVRTSHMQLVRPDGSGQRRRLTVPMHTPGCAGTDTSAPTVRQALQTVVARADGYTPDYAEWARNNGYSPTDQGWQGSSSYMLGRAAHKEARHARERIDSFLDEGEYAMIRDELRATGEIR